MAEIIFYGAPAVAIAATVWCGFLGWRFYFQEVLKKEED